MYNSSYTFNFVPKHREKRYLQSWWLQSWFLQVNVSTTEWCEINLKSFVSRYLGVKKVQLIAMDLVNTWKKAQNMTTTYFNDQLVYVSHSLLHAIIIKTLNGSYNVTLTYFRLSCFVPFESVFPSLHTAIARKLQLKDMFKEIFKT